MTLDEIERLQKLPTPDGCCRVCKQPPGFHCRAHFTAESTALRAALEKAEANAGVMRTALLSAAGRPLFTGPTACAECFAVIDSEEHQEWCSIGKALSSTAGTTLLTELADLRVIVREIGTELKKIREINWGDWKSDKDTRSIMDDLISRCALIKKG